MDPTRDLDTHAVTNQPPARGDRCLWAQDPVLRDHATGADADLLARHGTALGQAAMSEAGRAANRCKPELVAFDAGGRRLDEVRYHPAYHDFLSLGLGHGYAAGPWTGGSHVNHAAQVYLHSQVEPGSCCPMTMSYAAVPVLAACGRPDWATKLTCPAYDPALAPLAQKAAVTLGMAMTEKQGGSDLRAITTRAEADAEGWRLTGHKWFCSAPMSDGFLTLAREGDRTSCFLVPRWLPDGRRNAIHLMRLKDKLGNAANASAEIEYHGAWAERLGDAGRGVATIITMVHHTRLDTAMAPAGLMRAALDHLHHWVSHRSAFQRRLIDQPLMRVVLADLVLDWEGAVALGCHVARAFDGTSEAARGLARIGVALAKFLNNKLAPRVIAEAMEGLGGMGYVEDTALPMLYREAPLNGIWEGSGNVICLDILRTHDRDAAAAAALRAELVAAKGADRRYDAALSEHEARWAGLPEEGEARLFAEQLAGLLTASVLIRNAPGAVADAFVATRLGGGAGRIAGSLPGIDPAPILARLDGG